MLGEYLEINGDVTKEHLPRIQSKLPVSIKGSVGDGCLVQSDSSIQVWGTVGRSRIECPGKLSLYQGLMGQATCGGDMEAGFLLGAVAEAAGDLGVKAGIWDSRISCGGTLACADGRVAGGAVTAACIQVGELGSPLGVATMASVTHPRAGEPAVCARRLAYPGLRLQIEDAFMELRSPLEAIGFASQGGIIRARPIGN
jgi:uncharacterized protein (DUF342 family)